MDSIFTYCENPIFVAHNGNSFDHKLLLQKQILKPNKCRLLDSRIILRLFFHCKHITLIILFLTNISQ